MADINTESIGVYIPALDDRSEETLYLQAQNVVATRSQGQINDFSDSGPIGVLLRAQAFSGAELLYRANKMPVALVLKFLEVTGTARLLGQKAQVTITFTLTAPRSSAYTVPAGFQITNNTGEYSFYTDSLLTIPAGASSGTVTATAAAEGPTYNLPAYTINQITQPLAFLAGVINTEPAQGGAAAESIESAIARGLAVLRRRNLVSALDFREAAEAVMGSGSRAKAIGLLGSDKVTRQPGAVHVFCLDATGEPANQAVLGSVFNNLSQTLMLGTSLYTSPMELLEVDAEVIAKLQPEADPTVVAEAIWEAYQAYLTPAAYEPGQTLLIQELRHALRFVGGLKFIDELRLNSGFLDIPMPNAYTLPVAYSLSMSLVDENGNITQLLRGAGEPSDFDPQA
ncbi:baseplate J/gp47 family protein [Pseudanabaena sp. FACHB-2040]|uniref:baseplate J/gp47 family protein n=1 Tax=Pseudanabaena sp. FACHB-2040 TaxID=2692859 RepID=UPI0016899EFB|nr:baseplate J/gp47 family protein [Pseudanabaena sp. FACHB-2040]MBD2256643.1 baseplate J/gp47 family protein [Pseudanabaena sp. FACHB-2040]